MTQKTYREYLIEKILEWQSNQNFTREKLEKKRTETLELIYDTIE